MTNPVRAHRLEPPRIEQGRPMLIAGLARRYHGSNAGISAQWQAFLPYLPRIADRIGDVTYGVVFDALRAGASFGYLAGVEVADVDRLPSGLGHLELPAQRYAVFAHRGPVAEIPQTMGMIFREWLPASAHEHAADGAEFFERYGEAFDPKSGSGGVEIWLPIKS